MTQNSASVAVKTPAPTARLNLTRRPRRLRRTEAIRSLVRETRLTADSFVYPLFVCEGRGVTRPISSMPGVSQLSVDEAVREAEAAAADGIRAVMLFGLPSHKDAVGLAVVGRRRAGAGGDSRHQARRPVAGDHDRRVPVRVHLARPLRHRRGRRDRQRRHGGAPGRDGAVARRCRRGLRGAVGHDGRPRGGHPHRARRARIRPRRHHRARGEVLLGVLRPVPRGRRFDAAVRRSPQPSDGSGQRRRGAARGGDRSRRRRRHRHGEAGAALSRRRDPRENAIRPADGRLSGERRVLDDQGRRRARLDRRGPRACSRR